MSVKCGAHIAHACSSDRWSNGDVKIFHRCILCAGKAANVVVSQDGESIVDRLTTNLMKNPCYDDVTKHLPMIVYKYCSLKPDPHGPPTPSPTLVPTPKNRQTQCTGASSMLTDVECAAWIKYLHDLSASSTIKLVATCVSTLTARTDPCSCTAVQCDTAKRGIKGIKIPQAIPGIAGETPYDDSQADEISTADRHGVER
jgi:hypothetical protein